MGHVLLQGQRGCFSWSKIYRYVERNIRGEPTVIETCGCKLMLARNVCHNSLTSLSLAALLHVCLAWSGSPCMHCIPPVFTLCC